MNQRTNFYRKIVYGAGMALLLFPLSLLSSPRTVSDAGGKLAQLRDEHNLGQADLGDIDPASETMKLATVGLRGVAVNLLWGQANEYKKTENWSKLTATLDQLAKLQPNFITFWKYQSWNQSYNLSVEFDDYRDRYYYVRRGIEFLEEGEKYNRDNPQLLWELGWFVGQKIGRADEKVQYRRLFRADDEYHSPRENSGDLRDNWLVSKDWYNVAVEAADDKGKGIGRKSPIVFYSSAAKSQMNYAEAIEEEGRFDKAEAAWALSEAEWRDFGAREIEHSTGVLLRLNSAEQLEAEILAASDKLEAMAPGVAETLLDEAEATLTDDERSALKKPIRDRDDVERELAYQAERKLKFTPPQIAERIGAEQPEKKLAAAEAAADIVDLEKRLRFTNAYKQTGNYDYWLTRAEFEQTEAAVTARTLIYRGKRAFTEDLDPIKAKELYAQGLQKWREVLDAYPVLLEGEGTTGDDIFVHIRQYDEVLEQLEEDLPADFPLWDIVENFDGDRVLTDELARHKQRQQQAASSGKQEGQVEEPAAEPAEPAAPDAADSDVSDSDAADSEAADSGQPDESADPPVDEEAAPADDAPAAEPEPAETAAGVPADE